MNNNNHTCKTVRSIIKMDKGLSQTNGPNDKKVEDVGRLYASRKEGGRALKIALIHLFEDWKDYFKNIRKRLIPTGKNSTEKIMTNSTTKTWKEKNKEKIIWIF